LSNKSIDSFDVSVNQFTGRLDFDLIALKGGEYMANTNRFSGSLPVTSIEAFEEVEIISGNVISCGTIPRRDSSYDNYSCETRVMNVSAVAWCVCLGLFVIACLLLLYGARGDNALGQFVTRSKDILSDNFISVSPKRGSYGGCIKMSLLLSSLQSITTVTAVAVTAIIVGTVVFYSLLRLNTDYSTHYDQYIYKISGIFIRGANPSGVLLVIYLITFSYLTWKITFLFDFRIEDDSRSESRRRSKARRTYA